MTEDFCTYFDHRYVAKGLAMWRSLKKQNASAILHVLCLNEACREILAALRLPDVHLHCLKALEDADPDLLAARENRSFVEYYFTLTPCLPLYIFRTRPQITRLTYVDADLFFFADPRPVLEEVGDNSVGLIEHRFPDPLVDLEKHGRFNVGWLTFRNNPVALECLNVWREQCLEWCYDRVEPGRFAEQKYLDEWPARFPSVHIIQHRGANVAPWNLNRFEISLNGENVSVGGQPLIFFHAHGFQPASPGRPRGSNLKAYDVEETPLLSRNILDAYEKALVDATTEIAIPLALAMLSDQPRETAVLRERLEASEAHRAARLDLIHTLQKQLETLQKQLEASEADRAARLDLTQALQKQLAILQSQLEASEADRAARQEAIQTLQNQLRTNEVELHEIRTYLSRALSRIEALELSRSWRWTGPLRWVAGRLGKKDGGA